MKRAERYKKEAEKWEDEVKKNEEHLRKLESQTKHHKGELGVILWNSVVIINTIQADFIQTPD